MSYLHSPCLTFAGLFQANVPTGNNETSFYDLPPGTDPPPGPTNWNVMGGGQFRILDAAVTGVVDDAGADADADDPVRHAVVTDAVDRVAAKIVDLDPQYQVASALYGLRLRFVGADGTELLAGEFAPAAFRDLSFDGFGHARFVSVLRGLTWAEPGTSAFLDRLRAATGDGLVSIRLTTYDFFDAGPLTGRVVGAVGPHRPREPHRFVAGRHLRPPPAADGAPPSLNDCDAVVDPAGTQLTIDLSNSLALDLDAIPDGVDVHLALLGRRDIVAGDVVPEGPDVTVLGAPIPFRDPDWLRATSGLRTVDVPDTVREALLDHPLALVGGTGPFTVLVRETTDGWLVRAEHATRRLEPGASFATTVHVTRYGLPVEGVRLTPRTAPPDTDAGTGLPADRLAIHRPAPTDRHGTTVLRVTGDGRGPGNPRGHLDGQIYTVWLADGLLGQWDLMNDAVGVHLYDHHHVPSAPTWHGDIQPLLAPYAQLYPLMRRRVFDLGDLAAVALHRHVLQLVLRLDPSDPNHMPVTRDLSAAKRETILRWLASPGLPLGDAPPPQAADDGRAVRADGAGLPPAPDGAEPLAGKLRDARRLADASHDPEPSP